MTNADCDHDDTVKTYAYRDDEHQKWECSCGSHVTGPEPTLQQLRAAPEHLVGREVEYLDASRNAKNAKVRAWMQDAARKTRSTIEDLESQITEKRCWEDDCCGDPSECRRAEKMMLLRAHADELAIEAWEARS